MLKKKTKNENRIFSAVVVVFIHLLGDWSVLWSFEFVEVVLSILQTSSTFGLAGVLADPDKHLEAGVENECVIAEQQQ
jgi:hypothetical protein